jgi:hypothetical protein
MTQDQTNQAQGTGVAGGQVGQDEETGAAEAEQSGAVTRLKKVASALRGDRPDQAAPGQTVSDETIPDPATPDEMALTDRDTQNPGGSWSAGSDQDAAVNGAVAPDDMTGPQYANATGPAGAGTAAEDVSTVPGSAAADRYGQGGEQDVAAADPTQPGSATYDTTGPAGLTDPAPEEGNQAGTAAGYASQAGTAPAPSSFPGTTPEAGSPAGTSSGFASEAGTANGYGSPAGTGTDPQGLTGSTPGATATGPTEPVSTDPLSTEAVSAQPVSAQPVSAQPVSTEPDGRPAADDAGLRPGEATDRLGDFGDIAFGNLLPDADQYTTQWQQIQFRFVDDPQGSVTEAAEVITEVTSKLEAAIRERQQAIQERQRAIQERASALRGRWGEGSNADTETLRETLRMYRSFMDQLVGPAR